MKLIINQKLNNMNVLSSFTVVIILDVTIIMLNSVITLVIKQVNLIVNYSINKYISDKDQYLIF